MELECLKKALTGDRAALEELVEQCYPAVYGYLRRLTGSGDRAADLAQDAMVRMLERLHTYRPRPGTGFPAWVFRIARNLCIDEARRGRLRMSLPEQEQNHCAGDTTYEQAVDALEAGELRRALDGLPPGDRELLELRYFYEFSHREMAQVLDVRPAIVKSRLNAALGRLRKQYGKGGDACVKAIPEPKRS